MPVWISNLKRVMPKGAIIPLPLLSTVIFGEPLQQTQAMPKDEFLAYAEKNEMNNNNGLNLIEAELRHIFRDG